MTGLTVQLYQKAISEMHIYNLPTLISKSDNLYPQLPSPLLTMYTSEIGSTCPRSTLHQGSSSNCVCVHDPSA